MANTFVKMLLFCHVIYNLGDKTYFFKAYAENSCIFLPEDV